MASPKSKSLAETLDGLSISSSSPSQSNLTTSLRKSLSKGFHHWGSMKIKAAQASFTIRQNTNYDYFYCDDDPDVLFEETQGFFEEVQAMTPAMSSTQADAYEAFLASAFAELIFGSNFIENAGLGHDITMRICKEIFAGEIDPSETPFREDEYQQALEELKLRNLDSSHSAILQSRSEIVQHALALKHITTRMVLLNEPLSEQVILETHKILTHGIDGPAGERSETYSGIYRTETVVAGFSSFTPTAMVPAKMRDLVVDFNKDIEQADEKGQLDPYYIAAKYCHKFVNIHPFLDGNGRTCRLLLNAVLLKYAGIVIALGEKESDRDHYLQIAARGSEDEQIPEDDRTRKPWANLASFVIQKVVEKMETLRNALKNAS